MTDTSVAARWSTWAPYLLSILRIIAAFLFVQYGTTKLIAYPAPIMPDGGTAPLASLVGVAAAMELGGAHFCSWACSLGPWHSCCRAKWPWLISTLTRLKGSGPFSMTAHRPSSSASSGCIFPWPAPAHGASMRFHTARGAHSRL